MSDLPPPPPPNMQPPPGYVAYGGHAMAAGPVKPIRSLGKWLFGLIIAGLVMQALAVVVQLTLRDAAREFLITGDVGAFDDDFAVFFLVTLLATGIAIAQVVVLCVWTFRMAKNGLALGRTPQSFGAGATIAVNLLGGCTLGILPFFMWRELWWASDPDTPRGDLTWKRRPLTALIPVHLGLTLAGVASGLVVSAARGFSNGITFGTDRGSIAESLDDKVTLVALGGLITVATSVVFVMIVRQLTDRHARAIGEA